MNYELKAMKYILPCIISISCLLINPSSSIAESPANAIKEGNTFYQQGEYDEAVRKYQDAEEISPGSDIANFNHGAALFKKGEFQESVDAFTRSLNTENSQLEADAVYNIANAKYKLGNGVVESDMNSAANLYRESLDYYKRAIELDEKNTDAKHNHELTHRELKILLKKIEEQPQQQQGDKQDKKEGDKEKQESQQSQAESKQDEEDKEQQEAQEEQDTQEKQKANNSSEEQTDNKESGEEESPAPTEEKPGEMSPEEARMLLDAYAEEEAMDNLEKKRKGYNAEVLKDW